jgi:hypothetical protein
MRSTIISSRWIRPNKKDNMTSCYLGAVEILSSTSYPTPSEIRLRLVAMRDIGEGDETGEIKEETRPTERERETLKRSTRYEGEAYLPTW